MQQEQNNEVEMPAVISQENHMQNNQNNNRRQRMKWTKNLNTDIIRCYFNTVLRIPNQPYRKQFHDRWKILHPDLQLTEQRICDQHRTIISKTNTRENIRGNWLTEIEIQEIRNSIQQQINAENLHNNINNNEQDQQEINEELEDTIVNLQDNQPPVERGEANQNHPEYNEIEELRQMILEEYAQSVITPFEDRYEIRKPSRKSEKILEKAVGKVNEALEDAAVLTEISDVTNLNHLVYASAITAIKQAELQRECLPKKQKQNE